MTTVSGTRFSQYHHVDADPRAAPGSFERLRWEYACARMDADAFQERAVLASAHGRLSARDRAHYVGLLGAAMGASRRLLRAIEIGPPKAL